MTGRRADGRTDCPTVVLVPGLGLDERTWRGVRDRLAGRHLVAPLPSLGRRAPRGTDLSVPRQAQRLLDRLREAGVTSAVLVGHSASCAVVTEAATRSRLVAGLVLVGPVTDPRARGWPRMLLRWLRTAVHERAWEVPVLVPQYLRCGPLTMLRSMDEVRHYATGRALAGLDLPVVVLRGQLDRIAPDDWSADLTDDGPRRLRTAPGSGHMVPLTDPGAVVDAIEQVRSVLAGGPGRR